MKKIFVTVGTQLPFPRLIEAMDEWAINHMEIEVNAQIGHSKIVPKAMKICSELTPSSYNATVQESNVLVGHLGTGTIATAYKYEKPAILMPRRYDFGEHRNNHQMDMARDFVKQNGIYIVYEKKMLFKLLENIEILTFGKNKNFENRDKLTKYLSHEILQGNS